MSIFPMDSSGKISRTVTKGGKAGASALDATSIIKGLIGLDATSKAKAVAAGVLGTTGLHVTEDYGAKAKPPVRGHWRQVFQP